MVYLMILQLVVLGYLAGHHGGRVAALEAQVDAIREAQDSLREEIYQKFLSPLEQPEMPEKPAMARGK